MYNLTEIKQNRITRLMCLEKGGRLCSVEKRRKTARIVLGVVVRTPQKLQKKALLQSNQKQNNPLLQNNQLRVVVAERKVELLQNLANS